MSILKNQKVENRTLLHGKLFGEVFAIGGNESCQTIEQHSKVEFLHAEASTETFQVYFKTNWPPCRNAVLKLGDFLMMKLFLSQKNEGNHQYTLLRLYTVHEIDTVVFSFNRLQY
jgi:hypothetical protein